MNIGQVDSFKTVVLSFLSDNTRQALVPAIRGVVPNTSIKTFKSLDQTLNACLEEDGSVGTVFIEFGYPLQELATYIQMMREDKKHKPDKIILLVEQDEVNEDLLSTYLRIGFSGVLTKPFSEKSVADVFKISQRLSELGSIARLKVATGLQIKNMLEQKGDKFQASSILTSVKNACRKFEEENPDKSINQIAEKYSSMNPNERLGKNIKDMYQGASKRVREMLQGK